VVKVKEALLWCAVWVTLSLAFSVFVYYGYENHWDLVVRLMVPTG
jgi:hypothetical protein